MYFYHQSKKDILQNDAVFGWKIVICLKINKFFYTLYMQNSFFTIGAVETGLKPVSTTLSSTTLKSRVFTKNTPL